MSGSHEIVIRLARPDDADGLRRLAELDSSSPPGGDVLLLEVEGELRAALALDGSPPIADPFEQTASLIELLRLRAAQLLAAAPPDRARWHPVPALGWRPNPLS